MKMLPSHRIKKILDNLCSNGLQSFVFTYGIWLNMWQVSSENNVQIDFIGTYYDSAISL